MESTISALVVAAETGDEAASRNLFATLYAELHRIARRELARPGAPPSLGDNFAGIRNDDLALGSGQRCPNVGAVVLALEIEIGIGPEPF